ncbi:MAG: 2'-5' RNA ligase family protein [Bacillota bacterium]|nr:2'-5' RNA ligase family protein [Bacillota bacterium]
MGGPSGACIILLWPSEEDAAAIERYRREVSAQAQATLTLKWPVHLSLFYGVEIETPELLSEKLRAIARSTHAPCLDLEAPGAFSESALYIRVRPCPEVLALQDRVREALHEAGAVTPGYPVRATETTVTPAEAANIRQWGSYYPYLPHLTVGILSEREKLGRAMEVAAQLLSMLPSRIIADRMSLALIGDVWGVSETIESYNLIPPEPGATAPGTAPPGTTPPRR